MTTCCQHCAIEFAPKRSTAQFCSTACRMSAHRGRPPKTPVAARAVAKGPVTGRARATDAPEAPKVCYAKSTEIPPRRHRAGRPVDEHVPDQATWRRAFGHVFAHVGEGAIAIGAVLEASRKR